MTALPHFQVLQLTSVTKIYLNNNPWSCDCHALWMKQWFNKLGSAVVNPDSIKCHSDDLRHGISIYELNDDYFVCHRILSVTEYTCIVVPTVFGACFLLALFITLAVYAKRHWLYAKYNFHLFDIDECSGEEMVYDAFISYANEDEYDIIELVNVLEEKHSFKLCYHHRDFQPGVASLVNMETAILKSKRTLCYITENFLKSNWCKWEFMMALSLDLERKRRRLIVIKDTSLDVVGVNSFSIQSYLSSYTYVEYPSHYFTRNLLYWLPQNRMPQRAATYDSVNETSPLISED